MRSGTINGELVTSAEYISVLSSADGHIILKDQATGAITEVFATASGLSDGNALGPVSVEMESERARIIRERFQGTGNSGLGTGTAGDGQTKVLKSPMPGMVKSVLIEIGATVKKNSTVVILEAMKMENSITAGAEGTIKKIHVVAGSSVEKSAVICEIQVG